MRLGLLVSGVSLIVMCKCVWGVLSVVFGRCHVATYTPPFSVDESDPEWVGSSAVPRWGLLLLLSDNLWRDCERTRLLGCVCSPCWVAPSGIVFCPYWVACSNAWGVFLVEITNQPSFHWVVQEVQALE